jgi:hypothetical protein
MGCLTPAQELERQIENRQDDVAKVHKFEETMRNAAAEVVHCDSPVFSLVAFHFFYADNFFLQFSSKESQLAEVQSRLCMLLERSRLAEERAASSELRLQCIQDKIDLKVKDNAAMEQRRKDNLGACSRKSSILRGGLTSLIRSCRN